MSIVKKTRARKKKIEPITVNVTDHVIILKVRAHSSVPGMARGLGLDVMIDGDNVRSNIQLKSGSEIEILIGRKLPKESPEAQELQGRIEKFA